MILQDNVIVLSGVGPGLGAALARRCAAAGADVVLAARTRATLGSVADDVRSEGRRALVAPTDVTDPDAVARLVDAANTEFGRVDGLINNAFTIPPLADLGATDPRDIRRTFETCVFGSLAVTLAFAPLLAQTAGSVVMINSAVLRHSRPLYGGYKMAKSALLAEARSLATELGPTGVRVNSVAPGWIWADTLRWYFEWQAEQRGVDPSTIYDETARTTDLRRLPEPDEIADAAVFLLSPLARAVTGQCLDVNCGEFHN